MIGGLKDRMLNISSSARWKFLLSGIAVICLITIASVFYSCFRTITITDGINAPKEILTFNKRYVADVLEAEKIALNDGDQMNVAYDDRIKDNMKIEIYRAFPISVTEKGETKQYKTTKTTVGEALNELGLAVKETDITTPGYYDVIAANSNISLVRTNLEIIEINEEIPYNCKDEINSTLASGQSRIVRNGKVGEKKVSYKVEYIDGVEKSREKIGETVIVEPIEQIRQVAPKKIENYQIASAGTITTSRSGNLSYSRVITANATAYDASSCGKSPSNPGYGVTATGRAAVKGVVAVDPSVIPLGTKLYIESADGSYVYGSAVAGDVGSAIKGNRIDLCFNTRNEAISFGRRQVKVYILN